MHPTQTFVRTPDAAVRVPLRLRCAAAPVCDSRQEVVEVADEALPGRELAELLRGLPGWEGGPGGIRKTFRLPGFRRAIAFVDAVAAIAEEMDHHPDIDIRFDRVTLGLVTHDAGGVTRRDVELARRADGVAGGD